MKRFFALACTCLSLSALRAQDISRIINVPEVTRIETVLSSDDMGGRKPYTPSIEKAATFIAGEFEKAGLSRLPGLTAYQQPFYVYRAKFTEAAATLDGQAVDQANIIAITTDAELHVTPQSGYTVVHLQGDINLADTVSKLLAQKKPLLVFVNSSLAKDFGRIKRFKRDSFDPKQPAVFLLTDANPAAYDITVKHIITKSPLANVVGIIPGKSKKDEYVVFSGHYDHLGIGKQTAAGDSIFNGANDDAAGSTAVMMLAKYFAAQKNNERTLVFVTFTAEEIGGYGSQYFSRQMDADKVVAMFNIEMIGTESMWGKNTAYITGYERSSLGTILEKNLAGSVFSFKPDPYPKENLFYRSDNATLAALGVPAHTISTSQMDNEKFYHTQDDEIETLDIGNMTEIIKAIALSSASIISGQDTPTRIPKRTN